MSEKEKFIKAVEEKNADQPEFIQCVREIVESVWDVYESSDKFKKARVLDLLVEPERVIIFKVAWQDDAGDVCVNRGYRVQFNSAIGPFKGGLRFHPSVKLGLLKFLAFEQIFKNSLTTLPMGGAKGGSDFDPKGKSDNEVMRFCHAFMGELYRHIGPNTDVPAGDIGVGAREIGYMFGKYKKIKNEFTGVLTGKGATWGGSLIRPEATGYGLVYFVQDMLELVGKDLKDKTVAISGAGNVAQYAAEKVIQLGGKVIMLCDSHSTVIDEIGLDSDKLGHVMHIKNVKRGRIKEYSDKYPSVCVIGKNVWEVIKEKNIKVDVALPCATQNELDGENTKALIKNGCFCVAAGANMPLTSEAVALLRKNKILYGPGKAANAGGVATSGLEMTQNSLRFNWTREEVDGKLKEIMKSIHRQCVQYGSEDGYVDYVKGANIAGFLKVANAMIEQGVC
ncbi:MAG: NADP-specific glutamate dehydrogenase [Elusimicrobia bacterium HGW-Elusimicrobia-2]|nr:MAG: NADP-specific glutamate dehydrogenase [Elusimicrobia bacterium HGW-Elusimicrobia-2]